MPIKCPPAPVASNPALVIHTAILKAGSALTRFHSKSRAGNIYNPNTGKRIEIEEEGARLREYYIAVLAAIDEFEKKLAALRSAIERCDAGGLEQLLAEAKQVRDAVGS